MNTLNNKNHNNTTHDNNNINVIHNTTPIHMSNHSNHDKRNRDS